METPNSSTNSKGVKVDSYDWESNSESCRDSSEDSQRSNRFGENDVDGEKEGEGSASSVDDSFRLLTDTEIVQMTFVSEDEAGQFYNAYAKAIGFSVRKYKSRRQTGNEIHVGVADIAQVMAMRNVGMKAAEIMDYMTCQSGGFHNVGFIVKDLRNKLHSSRKAEIRNGDAEGALGFLAAQVSTDPLFFFKYTVDEEDRLETLLWTDGRSQMDYAAFGDVLVFDTTYRTNAYKKPFVILAGVSNNFTTTIFGCALLSKETEDTYNWVLSTFLEAMDGKRPISVVTNGDLAMRNAIRNIFPDARHRLCSWHLEQNAAKNVHILEFVSDFTTLMQMECDVEEFETIWADMVSHYGLQTNAWVVEMYSDRERWAEAYLLGHFFAGMRSTQRCEGMNRYLNRFVTVRLRLFEFVQQYHRGLARMRVADAGAETATEHSTPVLITQLKSLEKNGTEVYTQYIFRFFQDEIQRASALIVARRVDEVERRLYFVEMYLRRESNWTVEYYPVDNRMSCSCLMFESFGLPCCHMIMVMKYEHLSSIPPSLVMQRWTRSAQPPAKQPNIGEISRSISHTARYGILSSGYKLMSFYAAHAHDSFEDARQVEHEMTSWMRKRWEMRKNKECNAEIGEPIDGNTLFGVSDPRVVKTKGNPGKNSTAQHSRNPRKCSHCKCRGHNKRTCPKLSSMPPIDDVPI
ncbi:hypothetical protein RHMOL_Rhmol01G0367800 [Rhododendron molle]|uniref:Uncharacterized protein n=1 Tax=Rhododendron molle TaxID=49168 RepID=A0ACC0QBF4_RHOML|nr:hypothetical protein RHMOL_Rhmol01G0367800 [Rhododendron molle]